MLVSDPTSTPLAPAAHRPATDHSSTSPRLASPPAGGSRRVRRRGLSAAVTPLSSLLPALVLAGALLGLPWAGVSARETDGLAASTTSATVTTRTHGASAATSADPADTGDALGMDGGVVVRAAASYLVFALVGAAVLVTVAARHRPPARRRR